MGDDAKRKEIIARGRERALHRAYKARSMQVDRVVRNMISEKKYKNKQELGRAVEKATKERKKEKKVKVSREKVKSASDSRGPSRDAKGSCGRDWGAELEDLTERANHVSATLFKVRRLLSKMSSQDDEPCK